MMKVILGSVVVAILVAGAVTPTVLAEVDTSSDPRLKQCLIEYGPRATAAAAFTQQMLDCEQDMQSRAGATWPQIQGNEAARSIRNEIVRGFERDSMPCIVAALDHLERRTFVYEYAWRPRLRRMAVIEGQTIRATSAAHLRCSVATTDWMAR